MEQLLKWNEREREEKEREEERERGDAINTIITKCD